MSKFASLLGIGAGGGLKQAAQPLPKPLPKRTDKDVTDASQRARAAAKLRKGRRSTILTSGRGVLGELGSATRPAARSANLLGETI